jgi:hypothetical protein
MIVVVVPVKTLKSQLFCIYNLVEHTIIRHSAHFAWSNSRLTTSSNGLQV